MLAVLWWLVRHRLRLAHKQRHRGPEAARSNAVCHRIQGSVCPKPLHPASHAHRHPGTAQKKNSRKKKRLTMPCRGDVVHMDDGRRTKKKLDPARRDNTSNAHPGRTRHRKCRCANISKPDARVSRVLVVLLRGLSGPGRRVTGSLTDDG